MDTLEVIKSILKEKVDITNLNENDISISTILNDDGDIIGLICYVKNKNGGVVKWH